ncbi:MAG: PEP-CTERM sorting domain-containing protein [Chthonomonas sp.]|nr:PEP-CTERM sorting domain-containing protein [Chthonomonas sp.]
MKSRTALTLLVSCSPALVLAGLPKDQIVTSAFDFRPVVRIERGDGGYGTGSVIGRFLYDNGLKGKLCVLTADHVISTTGAQGGGIAGGLKIGTRNPDGSIGTPVTRNATVIGRQGKDGPQGNGARKWDLALLEIDWGFRDTEYDLLAGQRYSVDVWGGANLSFTSAGFGTTGDLTKNGGPIDTGYEYFANNPAHNDKKQRFWNNRMTLAPNNTAAPGGYVHDGLEWVLDNIDPAAKTGEGTGLPGDSGSPLLFDGADTLYQPKVDTIFTRSLRGVFNAFERRTFVGGFDVDWGFKGFAVRITDDNKKWIDQRCSTVVPEPASFVALSLAVSILALRRRPKG